MSARKFALQILVIVVLAFFDILISIPSCKISGEVRTGSHSDLTVVVMADLMLKGSDASFADRYFRDYYISKFIQRSLKKSKADIILVLGDISAKGSELSANKWLTILQQFQDMLGPSVGIPYHIALGDRDVGKCINLDAKVVSQVARNLPGLGSTGCGALEIGNISFVSLNAVALICDNNDLRFGVERAIESERIDTHKQKVDGSKEIRHTEERREIKNLPWIVDDVALGSGPVVLLHFPLYRMTKNSREINVRGDTCKMPRDRGNSVGPYVSKQTLPPNATEYILYSLKPRMIFSAHTHVFCDYIHSDGTREVTVPAMTWSGKAQPGLVVATFGHDKAITVSHCYFAKLSTVVMAYFVLLTLLYLTML